jgi:hypothetical protein
MVHAWRGVGKTRFAHSLGYAIATGGKFLNWQAPKPRSVLLVDGELTAPELQQRLKAVAGDKPNPNFRVLASDLYELGLPNLSTSQGQKLIEDAIGESEVIILDNQSTLFRSGVENEAESWLPVQQWFLGLRRRGKTVVLIHHSGKGGEQRGTSRREDVLDVVLSLRRPADYDAEEGARFEVRFEGARPHWGSDDKLRGPLRSRRARRPDVDNHSPGGQPEGGGARAGGRGQIGARHREGVRHFQVCRGPDLGREPTKCPSVPPP